MYWPLSPTTERGKSKNSTDMNLSPFNMYLFKFQMPGQIKNCVTKAIVVLTL